jgi:ABC-type antimicrobial peptide transport system permease subunit
VAVGLAAGATGALLATRVLRGQLYGVTPGDPVTLLVVLALMSGVAAIAIALPARRAVRIAPVEAMRRE